jgi:hypothetical protein
MIGVYKYILPINIFLEYWDKDDDNIFSLFLISVQIIELRILYVWITLPII